MFFLSGAKSISNSSPFSIRSRFYTTENKTFETILTQKKDQIGWITLNRPKALNALNQQLSNEVISVLENYDVDKEVRAIIITGNQKAFAAGVDIKMMAPLTYSDIYQKHLFSEWDKIKKIRKPIIAAVSGYALGGGCEIAMLCDIILAGESAKFGQPEINLGTIPGMGGTQRLVRAVGKSKAMEWILTGNMWDAHTAEKAGLVSRVVPDDQLLIEAEKLAKKIASMSVPAAMLVKEAINAAYETTLEQGVLHERRLFYSTFATHDRKEGMDAFANKRTPNWKDE